MQTGEYVHGKEKTILSSTRQFDSAGPPQPNYPLGWPPTPPVTKCVKYEYSELMPPLEVGVPTLQAPKLRCPSFNQLVLAK